MNDKVRNAGRRVSPLTRMVALEVTKASVRALAYMVADAAEAHLEKKFGKKTEERDA